MEEWFNNIDEGKMIGSILLDLRKAFDLVNHDILLRKLSMYQCSKQTLEWFQSYLSSRKQYVCVNGAQSSPEPVVCGVPQGSIIGPLLFLIYINDFDLCLSHCSADMYADDTTFHVSGKTTNEISMKLNEDSINIQKWCKDNKMVINTDKTKSMLICSKQRRRTLPENDVLSVLMGGRQLNNTNMEKLLGVKVDSNLTFQDQIDYVCKTVGSRLALLRRIKQYIDIPTCILFFNGFILPYIDYCSIIWSSCTRGNIERIEKLLKSAARIILNASYDERSMDLFSKLGWYTFEQRLKRKRLHLVYKALNDLCPHYMKDMFQYTSDVHNYALRSTSSSGLFLSRGDTEFHKKKFSYISAKEWNDLPPHVKAASSFTSFKRLIKDFI